ncbi:hypothetical protein CAPTEDRAFT_193393 [Capitella teleta]|uniref:G-protein coupled receptors family 1 profile domain-containing protein n=1 Tax=Capitella teleta TaxID=283909 RepID=R7U2N9_CAPTE|nr:hypothetical protein CAPTEDRAFT_193393 [Capitella teleta]|eukprot:ELT97435.1 hypothetical protein CAPTEDRAFT_193393 [Capitella teleta]
MNEVTDPGLLDATTEVVATAPAPSHMTPFFWGFIVILWITAAVTLFGNILVLLAFASDRKLGKINFNLYIVNLAITDICVSAIGMPLYALDLYRGSWPFDQVTCALWILLDWGMTFLSIFTLVAISVDRYWAACWPNSYRKLNVTKFRTLVTIAVAWLCVILIWVPPWLQDRLTYSEPGTCVWSAENNREYVLFVAIAGYHGPSFVMIFCYVKVYRVMQRSGTIFVRKIAPAVGSSKPGSSVVSQPSIQPSAGTSTIHTDDLSRGDQSTLTTTDGTSKGPAYISREVAQQKKQSQMTKERRMFVSLSYILIAYLVTWSPFHITFDVAYFKPDSVPFEWYSVAYSLAYANSMLNPILYATSSHDFRTAFKRILTCKILKK